MEYKWVNYDKEEFDEVMDSVDEEEEMEDFRSLFEVDGDGDPFPSAVITKYNIEGIKRFTKTYDLLKTMCGGQLNIKKEVATPDLPGYGGFIIEAPRFAFNKTDINTLSVVRKLTDGVSIEALTKGGIRIHIDINGLTDIIGGVK